MPFSVEEDAFVIENAFVIDGDKLLQFMSQCDGKLGEVARIVLSKKENRKEETE